MSNIFQTLSQFHQTQTKVDVLVVAGLSKPVLNALGALALLAEHVLVLEPNEMLWAAPLAAQRLDHLQHQSIVLAAQAQTQPFYVYNQAGFDGLHNATTAPHAPANLKLVEESTVQTTTMAQLAEQCRPLQHAQRWALLIDIGPEGHPVLHNLPETLHSQLAWVLHAPTQLDHLNLEAQGQALQALLEEPITFKKWCFYQRGRPQVNTAEHEAQLTLLRDEIQLLQDTLVQQDERIYGMEQELTQAQRNIAEREAQLAHLTSVKDGLQARLKQEIAAAAQHTERINDELRNVNAQVALVKELLHGAEHQQ